MTPKCHNPKSHNPKCHNPKCPTFFPQWGHALYYGLVLVCCSVRKKTEFRIRFKKRPGSSLIKRENIFNTKEISWMYSKFIYLFSPVLTSPTEMFSPTETFKHFMSLEIFWRNFMCEKSI